jgi:hypothetical protein
MMTFKFVLLTFMLSLFSSCVGTVQDAASPLTSIGANPKGLINFTGVYQANPISQDKIEILFYPAVGGSTKFYYTFYVGDKPLPYTVPSETLEADYRGLLKYTVVGLEPAKTYIVKGEAIDQISLDKDSNEVNVTVTTFANLVADFRGISSVNNTPGIDGIDSLNVRWTHASIDYANITGSAATDPKSYEIVAVDTLRLTPSDMDNTAKGPADGRHVKIIDYDPLINEGVIRGLKSNTKYYVRVRTLHKGSVEDLNVPKLRGEKNTNYLSISTLNSDLANIKNLESLLTSVNPGIAQSSSLVLSWLPITGVYDHLRLLYTVSPNPLSVEIGAECGVKTDPVPPEPSEDLINCRKIFGTTLTTIVGNLSRSKTFSFQLVACQDAECSISKVGPVKTGNTNPTFAGFTGIQSVRIATGVDEISKLFLNIPLPDFSQGDFDGYIVGFKSNNGDDFTELSEIGHITMSIDSYNFRTDTTITISGVDYKTGGLYCFSVYPFVYNTDGTKNAQPNGVWKCNTPEIKTPTKDQFPGITEASATGHDIGLTWEPPAGGVYESFEIYIRKTPGAFSFSQAKSQIASGVPVDYEQVILPWFMSSYKFTNLIAPVTYKIGMVTRYIYGASDTYHSEDNEKTFVCLVDASRDPVTTNYNLVQCTNGI